MSVTVQAIPRDPPSSASTLENVPKFYVPNILAFNLKKTQEVRLQTVETDGPSSRQNGDIVSEEGESGKMSPRRKENLRTRQQASSFLLEPFLKPVEHNLETNQENPVLKALFGGKNPQNLSSWNCMTRNSINNCHPFKKTELSHDLSNDDTPVQIPKSLAKESSSEKASNRQERNSETKTKVLKELQLNATLSTKSSSGICHSKSCTLNVRQQSSDKGSPSREKDLDLCVFNRRKKIISQSNLSPPKPRPQYINSDRLIQLRTIVDNAIKNHKVYSMTGCYNSVRNALKQRGWIEKIDNDIRGRRKINRYEEIGLYDAAFQYVQKYQTVAAMRLSMQTNSGYAHSDQVRYTGQGEAEIINKMLKNVTEDLCWLSKPYPYYCWKDFDKFEMVNRLPRSYFSNKVGLCNSLQQIQWFYETGVCSTQFPRTYNMSTKDEIEAFKDDFKLTACISTLKWLLHNYLTGGEKAVRSPEGKVDVNVIEFALRRCTEFVKTKQHEDIDVTDTSSTWEYQWDQFITQYYKIVNDGQILKDNKEGISIKAVVSNAQSMLNILKPYWPQFDIEGFQNFWIVKPGGRCCGAGIVIKNNLEQILTMVNPSTVRETRFIVQKYIERPLLIYNTKFDIRQWFLVTNVYPLTIWMYKESYLRFCSQPFTLRNTHESIHLCNNAVQRKYKNGKRDRSLPDENMWDCYTFQTYLKAIGHPDAWEKHIYPGMREGFVGALLASQETMERKKNCFELYGADFMISEALTDGPWLIEINSNPAMDSSTSVTARLCPQVLEDIIKVVIDRRDNKSASTGAFEMVFRQNCPPVPPYLGMSLCVKGKKAFKPTGDCRTITKKSKTKLPCESTHNTDTEEESTVEEIISVENSPKVPATPLKGVNSTDEVISNKTLDSEATKESTNKRRKIDWVRKNIESLKSIQSARQPKTTSLVNISPKPSPKKVNPEKTEKENVMQENVTQENVIQESAIQESVIQLLEDNRINDLLKHLEELQKERTEIQRQRQEGSKEREVQELILGGIETIKKNPHASLEELLAECEISKTLSKLLQLCQEETDSETVRWSDIVDKINQTYGLFTKCSTKSCLNFEAAFETELEREEVKAESEESLESYYSAHSQTSRTEGKTSLEYFKDWKSKIQETRKTCENLLEGLQLFKRTNSKVKFHEAVKKRMKDEVDFVRRVREHRNYRQRARSKREEEDRELFEAKERPKADEPRPGSKPWAGDGGPALAINSENGAVRNMNYSLPKIKQRSRPLLPNGSSGHGRKIDVALEQACCH